MSQILGTLEKDEIIKTEKEGDIKKIILVNEQGMDEVTRENRFARRFYAWDESRRDKFLVIKKPKIY